MFNLKIFFISLIILLFLDFLYLYINQSWYITETELSQSRPFELKWSGVFIRYLAQIIGLNIFVLQRHGSIFDAFIYGLVVYSNYIGTNYATIRHFDEKLAFFDLLKGCTIMSLTTVLTYKLI